jgi:glucose/mannose transport system permease protein
MARKAKRTSRNDRMALLAVIPLWLVSLFVYVGTVLWTFQISLTDSLILPSYNFVGLAQYADLAESSRWSRSLLNLAVFGSLFVVISMAIGLLLAILMDRKLRMEGFFRTIYLFPYAMSLVVTGLVWRWLMNPTSGIQAAMHAFGWGSFSFDWTTRRDMAIYALVIAGVWQASGVAMAIMMASLRGIDQDIWKAATVDGVSVWRVYLRVVLPMMQPAMITAFVLLMTTVVKSYDLVVALTDGGPGNSTEVPAKFVMEYLFNRQNIGLASAASTIMLLLTALILVPMALINRRGRQKGHAR